MPDASDLAVNALAARAFVTDRERDSPFLAFENERLAWLAEDEDEKTRDGS